VELNKDYVEDLQGNMVQVGDTIVYGATDGRSGGIRVGKVIKLTPEHITTDDDRYWGSGHKKPAKLTVEVSASSGYWAPEKPTSIDASLKRFVRL